MTLQQTRANYRQSTHEPRRLPLMLSVVTLLALVPLNASLGQQNANDSGAVKQTSSQDDEMFPETLPPQPKLKPVSWLGPGKSLITGSTLGDWEPISFGGEGDCFVKDSVLTIESGDPMSGVSYEGGKLPESNYEISLEARRVDGMDFFCGLTFPVNDSHCCLIVSGWAGAVVGLSNIDGQDASSNESRQLMKFEDKRWYRIRVRVLPERILVWIEDRCVIDQNIKGKQISLRGDTLSCRPLGLCTFQTTSETRKLILRRFKPMNGKKQGNAAKDLASDCAAVDRSR